MNVETLNEFAGFAGAASCQGLVQEVNAGDACSDRVLQIWAKLADLEREIWELELHRENEQSWSDMNFSAEYVRKLRAELLDMAERVQKLSR